MSINFAAMKQTKKNSSDHLDRLKKQAENMNKKGGGDRQKDERFWTPTRDDNGNGSAIIRFLPEPADEDFCWVVLYDHAFQGPGGWYINKSLSTLGKDSKDPVGKLNSALWNSGVESDKEISRKQKRRTKYVSNIYVVKDPGNPENEGKVFLYSYGVKIFKKIEDAMNPEFDDETPFNPFNFWTGANFRLKIRQVEGYPNYDKSEFDDPAPLFETDDAIEKVWNQQHSLSELKDPSTFKTYDELADRLYKVVGDYVGATNIDVRATIGLSNTEAPRASAPAERAEPAKQARTRVEEKVEVEKAETVKVADDDNDDDLMKMIEEYSS